MIMIERLVATFVILMLAGACALPVGAGTLGPGKAIPGYADEPLQPLPTRVDEDPRKTELGRRLFLDPRLSGDGTVSCANCHPLQRAGVDGLPRSVGIGGAVGKINAPTVYNSRYNFVQFWDGRAASLEAQIDGPLQSPIEMGSSWPEVIGKLNSDPWYRNAFTRIYGGEATPQAVRDAIATFERALVTPNSRFDRYLRGERDMLTDRERRGYALFKSYGCASCHQGWAVGGNMFEKMGLMGDYFADRGDVTRADQGRFNLTGVEEDRYEFKVPSLRNVALTAPYFHDGSAPALAQAVDEMARYQLGRPLSHEDRNAIVAFLRTLTGEFSPEAP